MNKNDQIAELKELLAVSDGQLQKNLRDAEYWEQRHTFQALRETSRVKKAETAALAAALTAETDRKQAEETATLKSIRDGFIPVAALRNCVSADYETQHNSTYQMSTFHLNVHTGNKIEQAIQDALLQKAPRILKYEGGFITNPLLEQSNNIGFYYPRVHVS